MTTTKITVEPGTPFIDVTREFDAPRELVLRAYTEPDLLPEWLGPRSMTMTIDYFEPRDGGRWRYIYRDEDGSEYAIHGVFHGDLSIDGIVQTFEFEGAPGHVSLENATFEERNGKTLLRQRSVYQSVEDRDAIAQSGVEADVNDSMERLDELLGRLVPAG